jgi:hypothetical protein
MPDDDIISGDEPPKGIGQINYEAFAAALGWKFRGIQLPPWGSPALMDYERRAFQAGAQQAMQRGWTDSSPSAGAHRRRT